MIPKGKPYVKFDSIENLPDGTKLMIEAKQKIVLFRTRNGPFISKQTVEQLQSQQQALGQNPGYRGIIEVPNEKVAEEARGSVSEYVRQETNSLDREA